MKRNRAFTALELMVVVATIAILAAILFPVFAKAREKARIANGLDPKTGQPGYTSKLEPVLEPVLVGYVPSKYRGQKLRIEKYKVDEGWLYIIRDVAEIGHWQSDEYKVVIAVTSPPNENELERMLR
jgi:prepilin-type N-terminal cleavage/methylation domain-containing protein